MFAASCLACVAMASAVMAQSTSGAANAHKPLLPTRLVARPSVSAVAPAAANEASSDQFVTGYHGHFACRWFSGMNRELAVAVSDLERSKVARLLQTGADINARASDSRAHGRTLLQMAIGYEWGLESIQILLASGADLAARDRLGNTALTLACQSDLGPDRAVVELLIRAGANVNAHGARGMTPLMCAALHDASGQLLQLLLAASADVAARDRMGWTALMHATRKRRESIEVVRMLMAAGAQVRATHKYGGTALLNAALNGHTQTVRLLIRAGANVNACDDASWTPLLCASMNGHLQTVIALVQAGADANVTDRLGRSAVELANINHHAQVVQQLTRGGTR